MRRYGGRSFPHRSLKRILGGGNFRLRVFHETQSGKFEPYNKVAPQSGSRERETRRRLGERSEYAGWVGGLEGASASADSVPMK